MIAYQRAGDTVAVVAPDQLARSVISPQQWLPNGPIYRTVIWRKHGYQLAGPTFDQPDVVAAA